MASGQAWRGPNRYRCWVGMRFEFNEYMEVCDGNRFSRPERHESVNVCKVRPTLRAFFSARDCLESSPTWMQRYQKPVGLVYDSKMSHPKCRGGLRMMETNLGCYLDPRGRVPRYQSHRNLTLSNCGQGLVRETRTVSLSTTSNEEVAGLEHLKINESNF